MRERFTVCDLQFFDIARDLQNTRAMGHTRPKILMTKTDMRTLIFTLFC